ncbi:MAG: DUF58 domain-containing protein [Verrucomicrobiales bacterium]|nr:DUF58 domain-containing protein [Verrucomicrobiales bacterium]MCP5527959.1 DUF58 domain-containing protein [Verrucomicrobiales bacterium]
MRIRNLELRARVVVEGFWSGIHRSPYHGFSVEFTEYRQYSPGDELRYLDWRVYARSDRFFIKRFEDETNLRCQLVVDQSRSMAYGSLAWNKAEYTRTLAAALAYFLHGQGDGVGLMTFDEKIRDYLPARHRASHLRRLMLTLEEVTGGRATDLVTPLQRVAELVRKRGLVILISDFLAPLERLEVALGQLAATGHDLILFQVLDPVEVSLEIGEPAVLEDPESGRTLMVDPATARRDYQRRLEGHCEMVRDLARRLGGECIRLTSDQPLELALFDFLGARRQRGPTTRRAQSRVAGRGG